MMEFDDMLESDYRGYLIDIEMEDNFAEELVEEDVKNKNVKSK